MVSTPVQKNQTLSVTSGTDGTKIASGSTTPGATNWHPIDGGIEVDVDTSAAGFTQTPIYVTSIAGDKYHWGTTGASSVYKATPTGFSIQIKWDKGFWDDNPLDIQEANSYKWHINWIGIEPSPKKTPFPAPTKYYGLVNKKSGRCIDVKGSSSDDGVILQQWDYLKGENQQWQFQDAGSGHYHIVSKKTGKFMCVVSGSTANGALLHQWVKLGQTGSEDQKWRLEDAGNGYFYIINKKSNKFISVTGGGSTANGAQLHQYDNVGGDDQKWKFEAV